MTARSNVELRPRPGSASQPAPARHTVHVRRGLTMIYLAVGLWGTVGPAMQLVVANGPANGPSIGFFRLALALPVLVIALAHTTGRLRFTVSRADLGLMLGFGLTMALFQLCFFGAITGVGVTAATLISVCLPPLLVTLAAAHLRGERASHLVLAALAMALVGSALTVLDTVGGGLGPAVLLGGALACGAALCAAGGTLIVRSLVERHHPLRVVTVAFSAASLLLLLSALPNGLVLDYTPVGWLALLYLALVPTALAYLLFLGGLGATTATVASIALVLEPLVAAALAFVLFGDRLGAFGVFGALLLLGAAVALTRGATSDTEGR